jgi:hypothetical protein
LFTDHAAIAGTKRTGDGYMAAEARIARTGIQNYNGYEVARPDLSTVRVYRSPEEVFAPAAMSSAAHKPLTVDHPGENVDATRWKGTAVGWTGGEIQRDGDYLRVPMMLADAGAIADVASGKRELSAGYTCDLRWGAGTTPQGETYDAVQTGIRINHVAIVAAGRAGAACRIGDAAPAAAYSANGINFDLVRSVIAEAERLKLALPVYVDHILKLAKSMGALNGNGIVGDAAPFSLTDSAGKPIRLMDRDTHRPVTLDAMTIAAIRAEALKAGQPLGQFVRDTLRYVPATY